MLALSSGSGFGGAAVMGEVFLVTATLAMLTSWMLLLLLLMVRLQEGC